MVSVQSRSLRFGDGTGVSFLNFALPPGGGRALRQRLKECCTRAGLEGVVRQTFFVPDAGTRDAVKTLMDEIYGTSLPATTIVLQPPVGGGMAAAEIWAFDAARVKSRSKGVAVADAGGAQWTFTGGIEEEGAASPPQATAGVLSRGESVLAGAGASFAEAVRLWYYIGDILGRNGEEKRYGLFNRARNDFYRDKWPDLCLSPASTGIGALGRNITFEVLTMRWGGADRRCVWIDNPLQTPPYRYEIEMKRHGQTPSFSRAAAARLDGAVLIFISGTASVRRSELLCPDDAAGQTAITLDNIATLIGGDNLRRYGFEGGASLRDVLQYRLYVKRPEDVERVRAVCGERLGGVPHVEMIADICWPGFLLEIEGVAAIPLPV